MKKYLMTGISVMLMLCMLVGCGAPTAVDVSDDLEFTVNGDTAVLDTYPGDETSIIIPETLGGKPVTAILPSFTEGKQFKAVKLPTTLTTYAMTENGFAICNSQFESNKKLPINEFTAKGIYCDFFHTDSIWVNGQKYTFNAEKALTAKSLTSTTWKASCELKGEAAVVYLEFFSDGKQFRVSREGKTISHIFDYTVEDGKIVFEDYTTGASGQLSAAPGPAGEMYEIERIGDALVIWQDNIIFYPVKELDKAKPESTDVWEYEKADRGIMITGYKGMAPIPQFPTEIDGKEVCYIKSTVADDYNFANISINTFDFFEKRDDGYLYLNSFGGGNSIHLTNELTRQAAYCEFFGKESMVVNDRVYRYSPDDYTVDDYAGIDWIADGNEKHPGSIALELHKNGQAKLVDHDTDETQSGTFTYENGLIRLSIGGQTAELTFTGDSLVCWKKAPLFADILGDELIVFELPYYMTLQGFVNSTNAWKWHADFCGDTPAHDSSFTIENWSIILDADANSPIPSGTYDFKLQGNRLLLIGNGNTYTMRFDGSRLVDSAGNVYAEVYDK